MSEILLKVQLEELEEGGFLATSDDLPGLVAQGRTVAETLEIAQDVARKVVESYRERFLSKDPVKGSEVSSPQSQ